MKFCLQLENFHFTYFKRIFQLQKETYSSRFGKLRFRFHPHHSVNLNPRPGRSCLDNQVPQHPADSLLNPQTPTPSFSVLLGRPQQSIQKVNVRDYTMKLCNISHYYCLNILLRPLSQHLFCVHLRLYEVNQNKSSLIQNSCMCQIISIMKNRPL